MNSRIMKACRESLLMQAPRNCTTLESWFKDCSIVTSCSRTVSSRLCKAQA